MTLIGAAVVLWLLGNLGCLGGAASFCVFFGLFFATLTHAARGERGLATPDVSEVFNDVIRPGVLGALAILIVVGPTLAWFFWRPGGWEAPWLEDPVLWLLAVACVLYVPMACIHAALGAGVLRMLNPLAIVGGAVKLGRDYAIAVGTVGLLVVTHVLVSFVSVGSVPIISGIVRTGLGLIAPLWIARTLGTLMYVRGDDLGLGMESDYQDLLLPDATPRGTAPATHASGPSPTDAALPARPPRHEAIELEPEEPVPMAAPRPRAIELDPEAPAFMAAPRPHAIELEPEASAPVAAPPASPVEQLIDVVNRGDLPAAAHLYATLQTPQAVPAATLYALARSAASNEDYMLAAKALNVAARSSDVEVAPNALLVLARILQNRLQRPADARAALDHLLARYPDSPAAAQAHRLLGP